VSILRNTGGFIDDPVIALRHVRSFALRSGFHFDKIAEPATIRNLALRINWMRCNKV